MRIRIRIRIRIRNPALKPNSQETAQNFEKSCLQKYLRITFYTYVPKNHYHFIFKKSLCPNHALSFGEYVTYNFYEETN